MKKHFFYNGMVELPFVCLVVSLLSLMFFAGKGVCSTIEMDLRDLTDRASHVIVGKVISKKSSWNPDRRKIHTEVTVSVQQQIKGSLEKGEIIVVRYLGG